ncbi:hypothetical protein EVAR_85906_1 [Eumeta japonica]|uniref:RNase H type-1 domain-containing protein n=1 Tax=Eumeta variegata TaxID=151549 RepID=A0A4C2A7D1_EUMVA|nr:hypothetical protein EVAR_85906_1 [Eumeta japonica]
MYALYRAVAMVKATHAIRESTRNANAEGKEIRFYWLRAHVGIKGNERADELAKSLPKRLMPIMIMRKFPYPESIRNDQEIEANTGPDTNIHRTHGNSEYLHRFKLLQSPSCECDADKIESVWHITLECPRESLREATSRHRSMNRKRNEETPPTAPTSFQHKNPKRILKTKLQHCARRQRKECYVAQKQQESLGYEQGSGTVHGRKHGKARIGFEAHGKEQRFTFARLTTS